MIYNYSFAELNLRLITDNAITENGFAPVFKSDFANADITLHLNKGEVPGDVAPHYHTDTVGVSPDGAVVIHDLGTKQNGLCIRKTEKDGEYTVIYNDEKYLEGRYIFGLIDLPGLLVDFNRVMLHSSYIIYNGKAVLFCGKSGVGKSTQADLWKKFAGAEIINGDKTALFIKNGKPFVSSLPVAGTSGICKNLIAPLDAVVFLSQGKTNVITPLSRFDAALKTLENCIIDIWKNGETDKVLSLIACIFKSARAFSFACLPDSSAVDILKDKLENE